MNEQTTRYPYLTITTDHASAESLSVWLFDAGATGVEERDGTTMTPSDAAFAAAASNMGPEYVQLVAHFESEHEAKAALAGIANGDPGLTARAELSYIEGDEWRDAWKRFFKPIRIGSRLWVRPPWEQVPSLSGEQVVVMDPGRAFGSGMHETSQLVLRELDRRIGGGEDLLDVGAGSGILSIAALQLGARRAVAIDNDADTVSVAIENAKVNGVGDRFEASATPLSQVEGVFPWVVANIETRILLPMASDLMAKVAPSGRLILSGILRDEEEAILEGFRDFNLTFVTRQGEWSCVSLRRLALSREAGV